MENIRLLIIEDNRLLRDGILSMLNKQPDIILFGASGIRAHNFKKIIEFEPNMILLDLGLRSHNSLRMIKSLKSNFPDARIIAMYLSPVKENVMQFVEAGATGFIMKDATVDVFIKTIWEVARGETILPSLMADTLFCEIAGDAVKANDSDFKEELRITARELEVLKLINEGLSNREIGLQLHISHNTVKTHVYNIMDKLSLHTRMEVASFPTNRLN
ncbi:MAG: response regulator transcription factor [Balneolales bacterium]